MFPIKPQKRGRPTPWQKNQILIYIKEENLNGLKLLLSAAKITHLDLSSSGIGDRGAKFLAKALKENETIFYIDLSHNKISNHGVKFIAEMLEEKNSMVATLNLENNCINNEGASHIAKMLKKNSSLTSMNLSENNFDDAGMIHIAEAFKHNSSLTSLEANGNLFHDEAVKSIAHALEENISLISIKYFYSILHFSDEMRTCSKKIEEYLERNENIRKNALLTSKIMELWSKAPVEICQLIAAFEYPSTQNPYMLQQSKIFTAGKSSKSEKIRKIGFSSHSAPSTQCLF